MHLVAKGGFSSAEAFAAQAIALLLEDGTELQVFADRINEVHDQAMAVPRAEGVDVPFMAVRHAYRRTRRNLLTCSDIQERLDVPADAG